MTARHLSITAVPALSPGQLADVRRLQLTCEEADGLDLKVTPNGVHAGPVEGQFLVRAGDELVGYLGVDPGQDTEICGMVHPLHRRRGIGTALLERALEASAALKHDTALVICEDLAPQAGEWMQRRGGVLDSSELRMVLRGEPAIPCPAAPAGEPAVTLRRSAPADRDWLVALLTTGFENMSQEVLQVIVGRHDSPGEESLVASEGGEAVATVRLVSTPQRWMVYGLVVDAGLRGRRLGTATMRAALHVLRDRGVSEVSLEVTPENLPAVRMYTGFGFITTTTYRYWRLRAR